MAYNKHSLFQNIHAFLSEEPRTSLSAIARALGVERHTIEKTVQSVKAMTFRQYQQQMLLAISTRLLLNPRLQIKEIALSLGYQYPRDFARFFSIMYRHGLGYCDYVDDCSLTSNSATCTANGRHYKTQQDPTCPAWFINSFVYWRRPGENPHCFSIPPVL
ncbi:MAG TPA: AraC family transcriptional regulator, partial [Acidobacteriota bacterium]|nr:AraC family transcriptional regulator [Acidobacteriota bacterium]